MGDLAPEMIQGKLGRTFPKNISGSNTDEPPCSLNSADTEKKGRIPHLLQKGEEPNKSKHQASCDKVVWVEVPSCGPMAWCGCLSMGRVWTGGQVLLAELAVIHAVVSSSSCHKQTLQHIISAGADNEKELVHSTKAAVQEGLCLCEMIHTWF